MAGLSFSWEITPAARKNQIRLFLLAALPPLLLFTTAYWVGRTELAAILVGIIILVGGWFVLNEVWKHPDRSYTISEKGIRIRKGKQQKDYQWQDFSCFYIYRGEFSSLSKDIAEEAWLGEQARRAINEVGAAAEGKLFFLRKYPSGLLGRMRKTFLVVHSLPENETEVQELLARYLKEEKFTPWTASGFTKRELS